MAKTNFLVFCEIIAPPPLMKTKEFSNARGAIIPQILQYINSNEFPQKQNQTSLLSDFKIKIFSIFQNLKSLFKIYQINLFLVPETCGDYTCKAGDELSFEKPNPTTKCETQKSNNVGICDDDFCCESNRNFWFHTYINLNQCHRHEKNY